MVRYHILFYRGAVEANWKYDLRDDTISFLLTDTSIFIMIVKLSLYNKQNDNHTVPPKKSMPKILFLSHQIT